MTSASKPSEPAPPSASAASASIASVSVDASATCVDAAAPPAKRVRRDYPWRDVYVRELGVRPVQLDATTGDAVLVECSFCVHFGREAPPAQPKTPVITKDGQPLKTRARTRNVAHWKYPFRTDNMRSHHVQQHALKWKTYQELLEQAKQDHIAAKMQGAVGDDWTSHVSEAEQRLAGFFGDAAAAGEATSCTPPANALMVVVPQARRLSRASSDTSVVQTPVTASHSDGCVAVATITAPAIVDVVVAAIVDVPEHLETSESGPAPSFFAPVTGDAAPNQCAVVVPSATALPRVLPLLRAGLSFSQTATILDVALPGQRLSRGDVAAYSRVVVASSLQRISGLLNAAWAYSLQLHVAEPSRLGYPAAVRVNVRVPIHQCRSVDEFHVITLALHPDAESVADSVAFLQKTLLSLDLKWADKVLSISIDGATHCLGDHADFVERQLIPLLDEPTVSVFNGRQFLERRVQAAWTAFLSDDDSDVSPFATTLLELVSRLRSDGAWVQRHGHCPIVRIQNVASVLRALNWLFANREAMPHECSALVAPSWWWLVACVVVEVWTSCHAAVQGLATAATREQTLDACGKLRAVLKAKCCVSELNDAEAGSLSSLKTTHDQAARLVTLVATNSAKKVASWDDKSMATCFRTLNVSARRIFDELSANDSAAPLMLAEREVSRFVLLTIGCVSLQLLTDAASAAESTPPPTMPLDFSILEPTRVVDLIERHSHRLEAAFPTSFLDLAAREIRELQALVSVVDTPLCQQLLTGSAASSFADAWALVPQFAAARALAAGLATTLPLSQQRHTPLRSFSRVENDQLPLFVLADLAVEAHAHALQSQRLQQAGDVLREAAVRVGESLVI